MTINQPHLQERRLLMRRNEKQPSKDFHDSLSGNYMLLTRICDDDDDDDDVYDDYHRQVASRSSNSITLPRTYVISQNLRLLLFSRGLFSWFYDVSTLAGLFSQSFVFQPIIWFPM